MVDQFIEQEATSRRRLDVGVAVDVRNRFVGTWSHGFEVAERVENGYLIRRRSDGAILPDVIGGDDVRLHGHKHGMWWY